jgi:HlyD family secretion protein
MPPKEGVLKRYTAGRGMVEVGEPLARLTNTTLLLEISNAETNYARTVNDMRMFRVQLEQQNLSSSNQLLDLNLALRQYERRYRNNKVLMEQDHISGKSMKYRRSSMR